MRATESSPLSVPVYQVLLSLSDRVLHGYAILKDIRERTAGEVILAAGTLYAAIGRLDEQGWIEEVRQPSDAGGGDPRRRYFRITADGLAAVRREADRLRRFARMAQDKRLLEETTSGGGE